MMDLLIHNGTIITDYAVFPGSIAVSGGKVVAILSPEEPLPQAKRLLDVKGKMVMPGCIDPHVHIQEPGFPNRDDFAHGTMAAAAGGITTILEHPVSSPPVKDRETFEGKLRLAREKSYIDFGLWGALFPHNFPDVEELFQLGCCAVKGFISYATDGYPSLNDTQLYEAFLHFRDHPDAIIALHAENGEMVLSGVERMKKAGRIDPLAHKESREDIVELEAINRALLFAKETGARLHIVHMSISKGGELIRKAKAEGVRVTAETCPHFLMSNADLLAEKGPFARLTPPLRSEENRRALWEYVKDGTIDFIASDHCPYAYEEKAAGLEDIWKCDNGIPGLGTLLPMMIDGMLNQHKIEPTQFVKLMSTNAAKIFGLYPTKGTILPGSDADITIFDPKQSWTFDSKERYYMCGWSPYDGQSIQGAVVSTIVRGETVFDNGKIVGKQGFGRFQNVKEIRQRAAADH